MHAGQGHRSLAPAAAPDASADVTEGLLAFKDSIPNFDSVAQIPAGQWSASGSPPCSPGVQWKYLICSAGQATGLDLTGIQLGGAAPGSHAHINAAMSMSSTGWPCTYTLTKQITAQGAVAFVTGSLMMPHLAGSRVVTVVAADWPSPNG